MMYIGGEMMVLEFKRIDRDTLSVMRDAVGSDMDYYSLCVDSVEDVLGSGDTYILNSANSCLLAVAEAVDDCVLVCDQGGWNGFIKSCEVFGKKVGYLPTDDGLINIERLRVYLEDSDVKSLYVTSLAGYTAKQPLDGIKKLCDVHDVLLILDISGSVGDESVYEYGDILIFSTGSPKIVNIENGGIIHNRTDRIQLNRHMLKSLKADNITCAGISHEIGKAREIYEKTAKANKYLKDRLMKELEENCDYTVIHPEHEGLNVMITTPSKGMAKKLAYNIRQNLETTGNIITTGPQYNRIKKASIIIETKNLHIDSLTRENMDYIVEILCSEINKMKK